MMDNKFPSLRQAERRSNPVVYRGFWIASLAMTETSLATGRVRAASLDHRRCRRGIIMPWPR
jgi:hypothetical protein